jgi:hypothetical protein
MKALQRIVSWTLMSALAAWVVALAWVPLPLPAHAAQAPSLPMVPIEIAMRLENIYGFSAKDKTYTVEGSFWLSFDQDAAALIVKAGVQPVDLVSFYNLVQPWNSQIEPLGEKPFLLEKGRLSQGYQFNALFYSNEINYYKSPFGQLPLSVILQPKQGALEGWADQVTLKAQRNGGELGRRAGLSGFDVAGWSFSTLNSGSTSTIGFGPASMAGRVDFEVIYQANAWASLVKWILPLAIVMLVMLLTPTLRNSFRSERLAIPPVLLLTLVFMQQSYRETLPTLPYLTFLDGLYAYSYIVALAFFVLFIWSSNISEGINPESVPAIERRTDKMDRLVQLASLAGYGGLIVAGFWLAFGWPRG